MISCLYNRGASSLALALVLVIDTPFSEFVTEHFITVSSSILRIKG